MPRLEEAHSSANCVPARLVCWCADSCASASYIRGQDERLQSALQLLGPLPLHPVPLPHCIPCHLEPSLTSSYSPAQLYELVSDVPAYANFIPFCTASTVLDAQGYPTSWKPGPEPFTVHAELAVGFGGLEERYVSKVVGTPFERVSVSLGPAQAEWGRSGDGLRGRVGARRRGI